MNSILVIGDIYAETQYFVEKIPTQNEFTIAHNATSVFGSKTINASRILSRLGNNISFFAHAGLDIDGKNAINALAVWKISSLVKLIPEEKTGKIVVITDQSGKSAITLFSGANQTISPDIIRGLKDQISNQDAVYAATNLPLESLYGLVKLCNETKKLLFIDVPNQHSLIDLSKLSSVSFFSPNRQETELLLNQKITTIEEAKAATLLLRKDLKGTIIITLDKDGCVFLKENEQVPKHIESISVSSVDETAAGDIFRAVFLSHFLKSKSIEDSVKKAIHIASESTKIKGVDNTLTNVVI